MARTLGGCWEERCSVCASDPGCRSSLKAVVVFELWIVHSSTISLYGGDFFRGLKETATPRQERQGLGLGLGLGLEGAASGPGKAPCLTDVVFFGLHRVLIVLFIPSILFLSFAGRSLALFEIEIARCGFSPGRA